MISSTAAQTISRVAKQKADTDNVDDYIAMITEESDTTADLFDHIADDTTTSQAKYPIFSGTLHKAMRVSVYLDNALDLREDYEDGLTKVEPTIRNIGRIAVQAITPAREAARWGDSLKISWNMLKEIRPYIKD